jgi:hypothetical protein
VCGNFQIFVGHGFTGCGKIPKVSFRGRGLPEESAFFLGLAKKQIPRFARDDIKPLFSSASLAAGLFKLSWASGPGFDLEFAGVPPVTPRDRLVF